MVAIQNPHRAINMFQNIMVCTQCSTIPRCFHRVCSKAPGLINDRLCTIIIKISTNHKHNGLHECLYDHSTNVTGSLQDA